MQSKYDTKILKKFTRLLPNRLMVGDGGDGGISKYNLEFGSWIPKSMCFQLLDANVVVVVAVL